MQTNLGSHVIEAALEEYRNGKALADRAVAQTGDRAFFAKLDEESNSIALMMKHVAGNLKSRWTDFLTSDGEKSSRDRDSEFEESGDTRAAILESWEEAWRCAFAAIEALAPDDLVRTVTIRGTSLTVARALARNLTHTASHVGQIILLAKHFAGPKWATLSIPRRIVKKA